jgi:hypothetical protein
MARQGGDQIASDQIGNIAGSISGETAGSVSYSQINIGGIKLTVVFFNGYENDTTTNQSFDFPIAYENTPVIVVGNSVLPSLSASKTALSITAPDATTVYTGYAIVVGQ